MMRGFGSMAAACAALGMMFNSAAALASTPNDLADLVGARAGQAEGQFEARGYHYIDGRKGSESSYGYWWNSSRKQCVRVTTSEGRYSAIQTTSSTDCNQKSGNDGTAAAVAIGAAALIGAIALSHKSHDHDDGNHYNDESRESEYERGYRDGLYNQSYHNYSRSDAYSDGYGAGVRQRANETSYRPGYYNGGGYAGYVNVYDLIGRDRYQAEAELGRRGFTSISRDAVQGQGHYATWWRAASQQCVSVHTRDNLVQDINSTRARNCR